MTRSLLAFAAAGSLAGQVPTAPTSIPLDETLVALFEPVIGPCELVSDDAYSNFRVVLSYDAGESSAAKLTVGGDHAVSLPPGGSREIEIAYEHLGAAPARVRVWHEGKLVDDGRDLAGSEVMPESGGRFLAGAPDSAEKFRMDGDFTVMVRFRTEANGTLVAKAPPEGKWAPDAKALFLRGGRLVYDIGWLGAMRGKARVNDGENHVAVLRVAEGVAQLYLDGELEAEQKEFTRQDQPEHVFKIGAASPNFGGDYEGEIANVRFWKRALSAAEVKQLAGGEAGSVNTPDFNWRPGSEAPKKERPVEMSFGAFPGYATKVKLSAGAGFRLKRALVQPLAVSDHAALVRGWDQAAYERGRTVYSQLCVTCHGTLDQPGSLPTAPRFHEGEFKNGRDPYRMFQTIEKGYGQMVPQPQYNTQQKYDVIHYLREEFLKGRNEDQLAPVDDDYLAKLPRGMSLREEAPVERKAPQYVLQDYGNVLFWTLQVEEGNIAQKGIAVRVDPGPGGVVQGKAWMLYDHDTMRLAACWTGDQFVDWKGIAFDGSHGTHTSIVGEKRSVFPNEPMWANPATGDFEDLRIRGRDGNPYGPLPSEWVQFKGLEFSGGNFDAFFDSLHYTVGDREVTETPTIGWDGTFVRLLGVGPSETELKLRYAPGRLHTIAASDKWTSLRVAIKEDEVTVAEGHGIYRTHPAIRPDAPAQLGTTAFIAQSFRRRFPGVLVTQIERGSDDGPFAVDVLTPPAPAENPWQSWMRTSGFDFFEGGKSAAVCTWNGDVWIVDGIDQSEGTLQWQRICAGLFQPLGLKIVDGEVFVGCRDMIAKLVDRNGDRETDFIECFNNDHQVTEHFHEFAMGLQTDDEGNFYYAKSARHALESVVPHHGTLLKVSNDGKETTILATGFRAANGVCLNPDGSFIVTDQEGHWNPKNRINWVQGTGVDDFYGNMYGYHSITDESDEAMNPPLCWITNSFDRSPAELLWVPQDSAWESLRGSLLNLSYGYGKIHVVPHERVGGQVQGGMCELPVAQFPTGIMRGRFHPGDGQLYTCGMFAWAGSQHQPGGFFRVRATGKPAYLPVGLATAPQTVTLTFTDPLDRESSENPQAWALEAWDLKRTKGYGSKHFNERRGAVESARLSDDGRTVTLTVPELAPTWGMAIRCQTRGADGGEVRREIHNSIHRLED